MKESVTKSIPSRCMCVHMGWTVGMVSKPNFGDWLGHSVEPRLLDRTRTVRPVGVSCTHVDSALTIFYKYNPSFNLSCGQIGLVQTMPRHLRPPNSLSPPLPYFTTTYFRPRGGWRYIGLHDRYDFFVELCGEVIPSEIQGQRRRGRLELQMALEGCAFGGLGVSDELVLACMGDQSMGGREAGREEREGRLLRFATSAAGMTPFFATSTSRYRTASAG